jgi:hypothetical protein
MKRLSGNGRSSGGDGGGVTVLSGDGSERAVPQRRAASARARSTSRQTRIRSRRAAKAGGGASLRRARKEAVSKPLAGRQQTVRAVNVVDPAPSSADTAFSLARIRVGKHRRHCFGQTPSFRPRIPGESLGDERRQSVFLGHPFE